MTYANAGHPAALLRLAGDDRTRELGLTGPLLGVIPDVTYGSAPVILTPGSHLFVSTDGLPETQDSGGKLWGEDHIRRSFDTLTSSDDLNRTIADILRLASDFRGPARKTDDVTVVLARFAPTAS
jgi:sigma-B regulation protein RsbU (phosphoserine phosphatase)